MRNLDQEFRIKRLLAERGETISSMARKMDKLVGSVANNIYGYRANQKLREEISRFLNQSVDQLFDGNGSRAETHA